MPQVVRTAAEKDPKAVTKMGEPIVRGLEPKAVSKLMADNYFADNYQRSGLRSAMRYFVRSAMGAKVNEIRGGLGNGEGSCRNH